jgi:hypothetical protein
MTTSPLPGRSSPATGPRHASTRLAGPAVVLAAVVAAVLLVAYAIFFVALAVGGDAAISDTWVGYEAGLALLGGLGASLVAFLMGVAARLRHEAHRFLWLPLALFPVLLALVVLAEVFWME